jgi:Fe-S-cluster-containing dehydrogenase component
MAKFGIVVDISKCNGCYNCFLACRDEYCGNDYPPYSLSQPMTGHFWMRIIEREIGKYPKVKVAYTALTCMHCDEPPCLQAAQNGAIYQRPDGIVIIDPEKARGQKEILSSCPYQVIFWNEEKQIPQKCTLCAHLLDKGWKEPRCVEACPTGALTFGDLDDPDSEVARLAASGKTEVLHPEYGMKERVTYIGIPRRFITGSVVFGDTDECAEGVMITLTGGNDIKTIKTNNYGDFEFEGLPENKDFTVEIAHPGYKSQDFKVTTSEDISLGDIILGKIPGEPEQKK